MHDMIHFTVGCCVIVTCCRWIFDFPQFVEIQVNSDSIEEQTTSVDFVRMLRGCWQHEMSSR